MKSTAQKPYLLYGAYLLITMGAIVFASYVHQLAQGVVFLDSYLNKMLSVVFNPTPLGFTLKQMLSLALTPIIIVALPAGIYRLIKGQLPPYLIECIWVLWIITAMAHLLSE